MRWLILQSGQWLPGQNISRAKEYHVKRTGKSLEHVDQCESNQGHYFPRQGSINIATSLLALYLYIYTCIVHIRFVFVCLLCCLTSQSKTMVMSRRSSNLANKIKFKPSYLSTLFLSNLFRPKRLIIVHILLPVTDNCPT